MSASPTTVPCTEASRTTGSSPAGPIQAPIPPRSQTSPNPSASFLRIFSPANEMAAKESQPAAAPVSDDRNEGAAVSPSAESPTPTTSNGTVMTCGSSQVSRSMNESASSVAANPNSASAARERPCRETATTAAAPPRSSTSG